MKGLKRLKRLKAIEACQENPLLGGVRALPTESASWRRRWGGFLREEDEELTQLVRKRQKQSL